MATSEHERRAGEVSPAARQRLASLHATMELLRAVDEAAGALSRAGSIGLHVSAAGSEALVTGIAAALAPRDWALPALRHGGLALARGASLSAFVGQLLGRSSDPARGRQEPGHASFRSLRVVSIGTAPGSQLPHAAGIARAMQAAGRGEVAVATCGHVATSTPDFHVALNFAALWQVPAVFVVAVGPGLAEQTASGSVAVKADAYGLPARRVDGGDVLAVEQAVLEALSRARAGDGPTLVEAPCPSPPLPLPLPGARPRLVGRAETSWSVEDPVERFTSELRAIGAMTETQAEDVRDRVTVQVAAAVREARALPPPPKGTLFDDVFARRTPALEDQRAEWLASRGPGA